MPSDGYNWFLILVAIIASVVLVAINVPAARVRNGVTPSQRDW